MQETQVWSLGQEDPLEKEMAPHSSTLAWKIPWTEVRGRLQSMVSQRVGHDWATSVHCRHQKLSANIEMPRQVQEANNVTKISKYSLLIKKRENMQN